MSNLGTKLSEILRASVPVVMGGVLWSYIAAAMLYGTLQAWSA
ncbi:MAG: hypothetical protein ABL951_11775 [Alphaproteobacteria bacterium]